MSVDDDNDDDDDVDDDVDDDDLVLDDILATRAVANSHVHRCLSGR